MSTLRFRRPPRAPRPAVPADDVELQAPPELARGGMQNFWFTALPALSGLGSVAYLLAGPPNPITYVAGSFFLISALAMVVGSLLSARSQNRGQVQQQRWEFLRHLTRSRDRVRRIAQAQRDREEWGGPPPDTLWSVAASERLWERRPDDDDFGAVRIGVGRQQLAATLVPAESGPVEDLDPLSATALRRFVTTHRTVPDLPLRVALRRFAGIGVTAPDDPDAARALVRALLCQAAVFHAPSDLIVVVATARPDHPDWAWVKWLPHARHPTELDYAGPVRLIDPSLQVLEDLLGAELTRRSGFNPHTDPATDLPHVLIVLDGARVTGSELALDPEGLQAVTVLDLDGHAAEVVRRGGVQLEIDGTDEPELSVVTGEQREHLGRADAVAAPVAEALARQLAGYRLATGALAQDLDTVEATLPALLGSPDAAALDLERLWRPRPLRDRLRAPIGIAADGSVLELDLKEAAQDGMGPHGLLVGATGSGKSELLRTLVLGLAATHPPDVLNMVLVDFKGGATFAGMSRLGQVAAVITNLQDDEGLVARMHQALSGELNRRQELLRAAGNLVSVRDYERARQRGAALAPLPNLLLVVDEFSELIAQREEFVELFVQIGRLGRSLGLHLLLASQRLEEGKIRGLEAHLSYRIALRTFSPEESRAVLGVDEAYTLPSSPGHGLLKTDTTVLTRFRTAYVSGPYGDGAELPDALLAGPSEVRPFPASVLPAPRHMAVRAAVPAAEDDPTRPTVLSVMVEQIAAGWRPGAPGLAAPARGTRGRSTCSWAGSPNIPAGASASPGRAVRPDRHRRPAVPAAPRTVRGRRLGSRRPHRDRRPPPVGQVDRAAHARGRARAAAHTRRGAVLLPRLLRGAAGDGRPPARRRGRRPAGARGRAAAGRRGRHDPGRPRAALPGARRRLHGDLPADARRRAGPATTRSATSSSSSTGGGCCAASSRSWRRRSSRWPPAR